MVTIFSKVEACSQVVHQQFSKATDFQLMPRVPKDGVAQVCSSLAVIVMFQWLTLCSEQAEKDILREAGIDRR